VQRFACFTSYSVAAALPSKILLKIFKLINGKRLVVDWVGSSNPPQWWVGDWWIFGHKCGDRTKQLKSEDWDGPASDTCVHAGTTCRAFKSRRRRRLLPFKHHAVLSSLKDPELADELLDWCEAPLKNGRNRAKSGGRSSRRREVSKTRQTLVGVPCFPFIESSFLQDRSRRLGRLFSSGPGSLCS